MVSTSFSVECLRACPEEFLANFATLDDRERRLTAHELLTALDEQYSSHLDLQDSVSRLIEHVLQDPQCNSLLRQNRYICLDSALNFGVEYGTPASKQKNELLIKIRSQPTWASFPTSLPWHMISTSTGRTTLGIVMLYQWFNVSRMMDMPTATSRLKAKLGIGRVTKRSLEELCSDLAYGLSRANIAGPRRNNTNSAMEKLPGSGRSLACELADQESSAPKHRSRQQQLGNDGGDTFTLTNALRQVKSHLSMA